MSIFNHFQQINLTKDQHQAVKQLQCFLEGEERVFILQGYAGSGKTTLLKGFVDYLNSLEKKYQLMAPTGRAAKVINQKTGFISTTIHKGIYNFNELLEIKKGEDEYDVSFLYQYKIKNNIEIHNTVIIVDEASMVSNILSEGEFFRFGSGRLLEDLINYSRIQEASTNSKIIFIGDPAQLPPIGMNYSPALDADYLKDKFNISAIGAEIKEVKRQNAENGILLSATKIRNCLSSGYFNELDLKENKIDIFNPKYEDYLDTYKAQQNQKIIICYQNKTALDLNIAIRKDKFGDNLPIQTTDIVIISGNNYRLGIMNGEFGVIAEANPSEEIRYVSFYDKGGEKKTVKLIWRKIILVLPDDKNQPKNITGYILENYLYGDTYLKSEEQRALYVDFKNRHPKLVKGTEEFKEALIHDVYFNCILLKYGYAVTCHKAQGGEWPNAFVFWDRGIETQFNFYEERQKLSGKTNSDFYRWAYTAVTRASKKLFCINPPNFSSFSKMKFIDVKVQQAFNTLVGQQTDSVEIELDEVYAELEKFGLTEAPQTIQNHFIHRWYYLKDHYIDMVGWEQKGYEIRYIFGRENKLVGIKYSINKQNVFNDSFYQKLPSHTNSDELFEIITNLLDKKPQVIVNRNVAEGILTQISHDFTFEEENPFLNKLFERLNSSKSIIGIITSVQHLDYRERYTFENEKVICVVDFEYDSDGFFGRVLPLANKCTNSELLSGIKLLIDDLKETNYVI